MSSRDRWQRRGSIALVAVALGFVIYPLVLREDDVISSDWPAFATGARIVLTEPTHLYDFDVQRRVQSDVTGGRKLVTLSIQGILPFVTPAWVAYVAVPFELLGTSLGGRLWMLFALVCLAAGLWLAARPRPPTAVLPAFASVLPAFASVPTALLLLNAQLDGLVALGIGAAVALWSRPYLAGLALGLALAKPQLVLPLGVAVIASRNWKVLAGWAVAGALLWAVPAAFNPSWVTGWVHALNGPVQVGSREVELAHFGTLLPDAWHGPAVAALSALAIAAVVAFAARVRTEPRRALSILVTGGVLAAPHALPTDLVLACVGLVIWGEARWFDWLLVSAAAIVCAAAPVPVPAVVGVLLLVWLCLRQAGFSAPRRAPEARTLTR